MGRAERYKNTLADGSVGGRSDQTSRTVATIETKRRGLPNLAFRDSARAPELSQITTTVPLICAVRSEAN